MSYLIYKRVLNAIPMIITISIISFVLVNFAPGDPVKAYITPESTVQDIEIIRESMGLNDNILVQYIRWGKNVLKGNLGYSFADHRPVLDKVVERLPATIGLMGVSMIFSILLGTIIGLVSAFYNNKLIDKILTFLNYIGISIPSFWFAMGMLHLFTLKLGWLPSIGMRSVGVHTNIDLLKHIVMPMLTLSISNTSVISRYVRSRTITQLNEDYVTVAMAQGASKREVLFKYVLKNSLLPLITIIGMSLPNLVSGAFITETIFGWPGLGQLGINSIFKFDYPMIMATTMFSSIILILGNLISDILYGVVDPRIKVVE
ncbi:MAG TPA: ABC transporter permease [Tissierellaceae bacterium]|nr:ABC transporter permease [Tissierellaceae bacterium]